MNNARTIVALSLLLTAVGGARATTDAGTLLAAVADTASSSSRVTAEAWMADYPATTETDSATVYAQTVGQVATVEWALERFETAGLSLPHVEVWMHPDDEGCRASSGDMRAGVLVIRNDRYIIHMCGNEFTLLHELAHVWDRHTLTDTQRAAFLALRGLEAWSTNADDWAHAGGEHLADVVAWGLHPEHVRPSRTKPNDDASLRASYEAATGRAPLDLAPQLEGARIFGAGPQLEAEVEDAIQRFRAAGLDLPDLRIYIHGDERPCNGAPGLFDRDRSGDRVDLCTTNRFVILHELAHAWEAQWVTTEVRNAFMAAVGADAWNDAAVPHGRRGIELAANIIAWGLLDTPLDKASQREYADLTSLYRLLTGLQSPRTSSSQRQAATIERPSATATTRSTPAMTTSTPTPEAIR